MEKRHIDECREFLARLRKKFPLQLPYKRSYEECIAGLNPWDEGLIGFARKTFTNKIPWDSCSWNHTIFPIDGDIIILGILQE